MSIDKIVDVIRNEVEKEIIEIIDYANSERENMLRESKSRIDEEFDMKKRSLIDDHTKRLALEKLSIDSEANRNLNETVSKVVEELYAETVSLIKERILSITNYRDIIINIITKSLSMLPSKGGAVIIMSSRDIKDHGDEIKKEIGKLGVKLEFQVGDIAGGAIIKQGKINIDSSLDRMVKMFDSEILNNIYKILPKVRV